MYKIKSKGLNSMYTTNMILISMFFIFALIFVLTAGISTINSKNSKDSYTYATGMNLKKHHSKSSTLYSPVYFYNVDGIQYVCGSNTSSSNKPSNANEKIYYNSKNPSDCLSDYEYRPMSFITFYIAPTVMLITFILGAHITFKAYKRRQRFKRLAECGTLVKNLPCKIIPANVFINNVRGYTLQVEYKTEYGETLTLESDVKFEQSSLYKKTADLLIDSFDKDNYFIDFNIER